MEYSTKKFFLADFLMSFLVVFGVVMFLPMLPSIQGIFKVSVSQISWLPNVGYLTMIIFAILAGKFINKIGYKRLLLMSLIIWIMGISIEVLAFKSLNYYVLVLGRFIEGMAEAIIFPILLSMNKAVFKNIRDERIGLSLMELGAALGGLVAAIIAGKFHNSPEQFLIIPVIIAGAIGIFIFRSISEVLTVKNEDVSKYIGIKEDKKEFLSLLIFIFMIQMIFSSIQVYLVYYMEVFSRSNYTGFVLAIEQVLLALGTITPILAFKQISFKITRNMIVLPCILGVSVLAMQISIYISVVSVALIAFFVGVGFTTLNIHLSKIISTKVSQKVSLYTSIRFLGGFCFPFVGVN